MLLHCIMHPTPQSRCELVMFRIHCFFSWRLFDFELCRGLAWVNYNTVIRLGHPVGCCAATCIPRCERRVKYAAPRRAPFAKQWRRRKTSGSMCFRRGCDYAVAVRKHAQFWVEIEEATVAGLFFWADNTERPISNQHALWHGACDMHSTLSKVPRERRLRRHVAKR